MTVGEKLHKVLASLRSAQADMEAFSLETQDKDAKQLFADTSEQLSQIIDRVSGRVNYVEQEESQYKRNPNKRNKK